MPSSERSFSEVLQDILRNIQEIIRSEVRLAKTEIQDEVVKAKSAGLWIATGAVAATFAVLFMLIVIFEALCMVVPNWAAALIVCGVLAIIAGATLSEGFKRFKQLHATPERTVESIKEKRRMGKTATQIESHIEQTRQNFGSNIQELEQKVKSVTDWKSHFQNSPMTMIGVAFGGGILLANMVRGGKRHRSFSSHEQNRPDPHAGTDRQKYKALET